LKGNKTSKVKAKSRWHDEIDKKISSKISKKVNNPSIVDGIINRFKSDGNNKRRRYSSYCNLYDEMRRVSNESDDETSERININNNNNNNFNRLPPIGTKPNSMLAFNNRSRSNSFSSNGPVISNNKLNYSKTIPSVIDENPFKERENIWKTDKCTSIFSSIHYCNSKFLITLLLVNKIILIY
jgi:hypothetical protein